MTPSPIMYSKHPHPSSATALFVLLIPFTYNFSTRLRVKDQSVANVIRVALFEWTPVVLLIALFCSRVPSMLLRSALVYLAFISLYEIGYMVNDLVIAPRERSGRRRGPQGAGSAWLVAWCATRLMTFALLTYVLVGQQEHARTQWFAYFATLAVVYIAHNVLHDRQLRMGTFICLTWYRFMAPLFFVLPEAYLGWVSFASVVCYSAYRLMVYQRDKGLLAISASELPRLRIVFSIWGVCLAAPMAVLRDGRAGAVLLLYVSLISLAIAAGTRAANQHAPE